MQNNITSKNTDSKTSFGYHDGEVETVISVDDEHWKTDFDAGSTAHHEIVLGYHSCCYFPNAPFQFLGLAQP